MSPRDKVVVVTTGAASGIGAAPARQIVRAIEDDRTRLLIGRDARVLDALYHMVPGRASGWLRAAARRQHRRA